MVQQEGGHGGRPTAREPAGVGGTPGLHLAWGDGGAAVFAICLVRTYTHSHSAGDEAPGPHRGRSPAEMTSAQPHS